MRRSRPAAQCLLHGARAARPPPRRRPFAFSRQLERAASTAAAAEQAPTSVRPATAPKPMIDVKHIRQNAALHEQNCMERNYKAQAAYPARIVALHEQWQASQPEARALRERSNVLRRQLASPATTHDADVRPGRDELLAQAREAKAQLAAVEAAEDRLRAEMEALALAMPNLTSEATPRGAEPRVLGYINDDDGGGGGGPEAATSDAVWRSHVHIGAELGLLDFAGAAAASGWGWYYLTNEGAQLEQALVAFALAAVARAGGWTHVSPPSMVYAHIAAACGFQPRDQGGEQQIYGVAQSAGDARPAHVLAATAEIALAGMKADSVLEAADLPVKMVGASRCFRAEGRRARRRRQGPVPRARVHQGRDVRLDAARPRRRRRRLRRDGRPADRHAARPRPALPPARDALGRSGRLGRPQGRHRGRLPLAPHRRQPRWLGRADVGQHLHRLPGPPPCHPPTPPRRPPGLPLDRQRHRPRRAARAGRGAGERLGRGRHERRHPRVPAPLDGRPEEDCPEAPPAVRCLAFE